MKQKLTYLFSLMLLCIFGTVSAVAETAVFEKQGSNNLTTATVGQVTLTDKSGSTGIQPGDQKFTIGGTQYTSMKLSGSRIFEFSIADGYEINSITVYATTKDTNTGTSGTSTNTGKCDNVPAKGSTPVEIDYTGETQIRFSTQSHVVIVVDYSAIATAAPVFTTDLEATANATVGIAKTFTVATDNATSYQWYVGGEAVEGATSASYDYVASATGAVEIYCDATNKIGSTKSTVCTVTAEAPAAAPTITTNLEAAYNVQLGKTITLSIEAENAASYQWYVGDVAVEGATSASYTYSASDIMGTAVVVYCAAINAAGSTNSNNATITTVGSTACQLTNIKFSNSAYGAISEPVVAQEAVGEEGEEGYKPAVEAKDAEIKVPYLAGTEAPIIDDASVVVSSDATWAVEGNVLTVTAQDGVTKTAYNINKVEITPLEVTPGTDIAATTFTEVPSWVFNPYGWDAQKGVKFAKPVDDANNMRIAKGNTRQYYFISAAKTLTLTSGSGGARPINVYKNGEKLSTPTSTGATGSTIEITLDEEAPCMITVESGSENSGDGGFTAYAVTANDAPIGTAPVIETDLPATAEATVGTAKTLTFEVTGATSYSWYQASSATADPANDTAIDEASNTLTYTATEAGTAYFYCVAANEIGQTPSTICAVTAVEAAQDVTATWDWQNANPASITSTNIQPQNASSTVALGTVASDVDGIEFEVWAAVEGTNVKLQYNTAGYAQFNTNTAIRVPVKNKGDLVTVVSYPGQSNYTVGGENATGQNTFSHTAKASEASKGYVEIVASKTAYIYSIAVTQYAPQPPTTLDNEAVTATFPFDLGTTGQKATFSNADYFITSKVVTGSNMGILDSKAVGGVTFTRIQPQTANAAAAENDYVLFQIQPKTGFTFTPTSVSLKAYKDGTGNGTLTIKAVTADGTETAIASDVVIQRNNATPAYSSLSYDDFSKVTPVEGPFSLKVYIGGNLATNKQVGLNDIIINGTLSGTEKEVPILGSFTINGTEYSAAEVFEDEYEATLKISKSETMVSSANPLEAVALTGEVGTITYDGDDTQCVVTIPMSATDADMTYVLTVVQKPDYTLTYYGVDGTTVLDTQVLEEDQTIGTFKVDIADVTAQDGYKARGWFKTNAVGTKYKTTDVVTSDLSLYAVETEIEIPAVGKSYKYDLTKAYFDIDDHEAITVDGGKYHNTHGFIFQNGQSFSVEVAGNAQFIIGLCSSSSDNPITVTKTGATDPVGTIASAKVSADGGATSFQYSGEATVLTFTFAGTAYIHNVNVYNVEELVEQDAETGVYVVPANDGEALMLAIASASATSSAAAPAMVFIPNGTYEIDGSQIDGNANVAAMTISGNNVSIIGESRDGVIIKTHITAEQESLKSALLGITGENTYIQDVTLINRADFDKTDGAERANAIRDVGNYSVLNNVYLKGTQDVYLTYRNKDNVAQKIFVNGGKIEGTVDFICGAGDVFFNEVDLYCANSEAADKTTEDYICAPATYDYENYGYVFNKCVITGEASQAYGATPNKGYYLVRTWQNDPKATYIDVDYSALAPHPDLFKEMNANTTTAKCHSYSSSDAEAANYSMENVLGASFAAEAQAAVAQAEAPTATIANGVITITPANGGDAGLYLIEKDGEFVALTAETTYTIEAEAEVEGNDVTDEPVYTVRAANAKGGFGEPATVSQETAVEIVEAAPEAKAAEGAFVIGGKVVIIKDGKQFTAAGARIK